MSIFVGECLGNGNSSDIQISVCEIIQACFMLFAHGMAELLPKMTGKVKKAPFYIVMIVYNTCKLPDFLVKYEHIIQTGRYYIWTFLELTESEM